MSRTALIAEEDAFMRDMLAKAVPSRYSCQYAASTGFEAVELVERNNPDLAIITHDLNVEQGIDAFTAMQRISQNSSVETTLLALTGSPSGKMDALRSGAHGYVSTPIGDTDIEDEIDAIEGTPQPRKDRFFDGDLRVTLIHPQGSTEEQSNYGDVLITDYGSIAMYDDDVPDWVQPGTDAVIGEPNGSVLRAFVITGIDQENSIRFLR